MKLYLIQTTNDHSALRLSNRSYFPIVMDLNRISLRDEWQCLNFHFDVDEKDPKDRPTICTVPSSGAIAFPLTAKDSIFPNPCVDLEFLSIQVNGESWLILNCLKTTKDYDLAKSKIFRDLDSGEIYFFQKLIVNDASVHDCDVFTIEDSNRMYLFSTPSFRQRILATEYGGLSFAEIGTLIDPSRDPPHRIA